MDKTESYIRKIKLYAARTAFSDRHCSKYGRFFAIEEKRNSTPGYIEYSMVITQQMAIT